MRRARGAVIVPAMPWWIDPWPYVQAAVMLALAALLMWLDRLRHGRSDHNAWEIAGKLLLLAAIINPAWSLFADRWWLYALHSIPAAVAAFICALKLAERFSARTTRDIGPGMLGFLAPVCIWIGLYTIAALTAVALHLFRAAM